MRRMKSAAALLLIALTALMLVGCAVPEDKDGVYVEIGVENVSTIGFQSASHSGGAGHADGSALVEETLKLDFDVRRGETFTLTAKDAAGNETARGAFTYDGGVMTVVLSGDGFALNDKAE